MSGIVQVKSVVEAGAKAASAVGGALEDKKLGPTDLVYAIPVAMALSQIVATDWEEFKKEIADIDSAEAGELAALFSQHFDIPQDSVEVMIEAGLAKIQPAYELISGLVTFLKAFKK